MQSEKLAAVGRLAASIAHEINNPLEAVTNLLYLIELTADRSQRAEFLKTAQQELDRVAKITTQTLRFHRQSTNKKSLFLRDVIESVIALLSARLRNGRIKLERDYQTRGEITGFDGDLRQVFLNLISNAADASSSGARIAVRIRDSIDFQSKKRGVRVLVADTGAGMSQPVVQRVFEPFFTTKETTGTGLGLWISKEILDHHKAKIRIRTRTDACSHGTVFSIFFPVQGE